MVGSASTGYLYGLCESNGATVGASIRGNGRSLPAIKATEERACKSHHQQNCLPCDFSHYESGYILYFSADGAQGSNPIDQQIQTSAQGNDSAGAIGRPTSEIGVRNKYKPRSVSVPREKPSSVGIDS